MAEETQIQPKQRAVRVREVTLDDGRHGWEYSDGNIRDDSGRMITPLAGKFTITQANASQLNRLRWEQSREAFAAGVAEGMIGKGKAPVDAWSAIGRKAAILLDTTSSVRGFADLARFAGEAGGFVPMARGREEMQEQEQQQPQIVVVILQYLSALQKPAEDVIDGTVKD